MCSTTKASFTTSMRVCLDGFLLGDGDASYCVSEAK